MQTYTEVFVVISRTTDIVWITNNIKLLYTLPVLSKVKLRCKISESPTQARSRYAFQNQTIVPAPFFRPRCKNKSTFHISKNIELSNEKFLPTPQLEKIILQWNNFLKGKYQERNLTILRIFQAIKMSY